MQAYVPTSVFCFYNRVKNDGSGAAYYAVPLPSTSIQNRSIKG